MFMSQFKGGISTIKGQAYDFLCTNVTAFKYITRDPMGASKETLVLKMIWNLKA